ncbi:MAG: hybrid sensor histidine kinase/response regulator [Acidobacteria bacterium]|nr:MAG: hybrid sensor histidine kinase/response regulator [Acidobacteriota bacterium]
MNMADKIKPGIHSSQTHREGQIATKSHLRRIERREWWLWTTAVIITLLLTAGMLSFLPSILRSGETGAVFDLRRAMWGLLGIVLLFDVYTVYQQLQLHRTRRRLYEREELFQLITENVADMIAVVDMEGHRLYNSPSYHRVLGYRTEELQSSSSFEQIHPDDRNRVRAAAMEARRTGVGKPLEYRMRHKDGTWRVLESTASVIRSRSGEPERLVIVNRDVTQRKEAEESLHVSESSFRSMIEDAPYGIYRAGVDGKLLRANPALQKMLGYEKLDELLNASLPTDVFRNHSDFNGLKELLQSANGFKDVEVELKRRDGAPITVRCTGRKVKEEHESVPCFDVFAEDVTERRILERQLRMAGKMEAVGRLSGGIAHDFNNILGVIIGYGQVLKRRLGSQNDLLECAEEIEKAGQRAASLTRQLLAFSRQQILTPSILKLNDLVLDMAKMLPRLLGEDIAVNTSLSSDLGMVKADQSQIEQVIMNLAVNARDAMPEGGTLRIETANVELDQAYAWQHPGAKPGHYVMLAVIDAGTGIDPDTITHIFEPFFTTKEVGKGTGLGLATVYGVVKQSGGYIWVESEPGKGASFQIFLPRVEEPATEVTARTPVVKTTRGSETILLVEDSEPLRKLTQSFLESHGFRVLVAQNGEEALQVETRHSGKIDLLLTDVVMPGINGRVLAERLLPRQPAMRVLYISGYTDNFVARHGVLEQGMILLHKPFTEEVLIKKMREVLDGKSVGQDHNNPGQGGEKK